MGYAKEKAAFVIWMGQGQNGYWPVLDAFVGAAKQWRALMPIQIQDQIFKACIPQVLEDICPTWF